MSKTPFLLGKEVISNHGSSSGIWPRFFIQIMDIAEYAMTKEEVDIIFDAFSERNIPDFADLYDLHNDIINKYSDFKNGLNNGDYFSKDKSGFFSIDRSIEIELHRIVKDFFIKGRLLINNFAKSKIIDSEYFVLSKFIIVKDKNFNRNKEEYLKNEPDNKYGRLIDIIENSRSKFLADFNEIRGHIEHENLEIPKFIINTDTGEISEPSLTNSGSLIKEISFMYYNILDMIELLLVLYFGINSVEKKKSIGLFIREEYDYSKLISRYVILPRLKMEGYRLII
jgi:hypothetical protein